MRQHCLAQFEINIPLSHRQEAGKGHRYLCKHEVLKRVRIRRLLNPLAVLDRQRYLWAIQSLSHWPPPPGGGQLVSSE